MGELEAIRGYEEREAQEGIHIHRCPRYGESVTPCCGKTPFEIPGWHRMTVKPELVNCGRLELEAEVERLRGVVEALENRVSPWSTREIVRRLALTTEHLLVAHNCDHEGYEADSAAVVAARAWLAGLEESPEEVYVLVDHGGGERGAARSVVIQGWYGYDRMAPCRLTLRQAKEVAERLLAAVAALEAGDK